MLQASLPDRADCAMLWLSGSARDTIAERKLYLRFFIIK